MKVLIYIILVCIILFFVNKFLSRFKFPKVGAIAVVTGAVKSGKTAISLALALSVYRRVLRRYKINCFFRKLFFVKRMPERPLFYSNIPLSLPFGYCVLTTDHLLRKVRFNFKSVVFIDEASLVADSQLIKDTVINNELLKFFKLFGHETHGGKLIVNSQQLSDLHYSLRRCMCQYFYIHDISSPFFPFVSYAHIREERYSEDGTTLNTYTEDVEEKLKTVIFRKSTFKRYDYCCFSSFTDNLLTDNRSVYLSKKASLKTNKVVSFRPEFNNMQVVEKE